MQDVKIKIALILTFKFPGLVALFNGNIHVPVGYCFFSERGGNSSIFYTFIISLYLPHSH